jgi:octaprenyl-diphosphate synthase
VKNKTSDKNNPLIDLRAIVKDDLDKVDELIYSLIVSKISLIPEISEHTISAGGKRLRPILTLASAQMCGYKGNAHIDLAACVEFIHTATLLHDDVVDKSDLRRGESTANSLWGNKESILVGDFLLGKAFQLMSAARSLEIYRILSNSAVVLSEGEVLQLAATGDLNGGEDVYIKIVAAKTAELFAASCEVGAVLAERSDEEVAALRSFGLNLGIAFQIIDDALDYYYSAGKTGKNIGDDFRERKVTLPVIFAYAAGDDEERKFWQRTIGDDNQKEGDVEQAVEYVKNHGVFEKVIDRADEYADAARKSLEIFDNSDLKNCLLGVVDFAVRREF